MKKLVIGFLLLASCGEDDSCEQLCERVDAVGCENQPELSECLDSCAEVDTCEKEYDRYMKCMLKQTSASDLSCDEETGQASFPEGICEAEAGEMLICALSELDMGE